MFQQWDQHVSDSLAHLRKRNLLRTLRPVISGLNAVDVLAPRSTMVPWLAEDWQESLIADTWPLKLFSLNDYLGLSTHPRVCAAAAAAASAGGMGPRSSALVGGYTVEHQQLEMAIAKLKCMEEALLFPSGFAANQAAVAALAGGSDCAVFSDEMNHASIIDGARLAKASGAALHIYRHNDMAHLARLLAEVPCGVRKLVVTDSLFSMDGDFADLLSLAALRREYGFLLAIDEAHATLVCGERGGGAAEAAGVADQVDLHLGTLSKAFGAQGGFVACRRDLKALLLNRGRPYIFSTALPLPTVAAAFAALHVSEQEPWRREHLWQLVNRLGSRLAVEVHSPIIPLILGHEGRTVSAAGALLARGLHVPAIRPPTVRPGSCRLRISLSAAHTTADVDQLADSLDACGLTYLDANRPSARL